ncbi:hypothetical protein HPB50_009689 [Hyalomma asiaticum]|uniref:Uncharacterized protein n=1 Tax=Hyalomma asiaticum TaxID=266040 RepID=A0ACB7SU43_HYAAI|nr:hypothetical protein HPB50_009689 [Hyalomma asiaticum]
MYVTSQWHSDIGISLQTGGIPESLTARSFLRFLGRLRGVPEWQLGDTVESLLALFDLTKKSDETCYTYTNTDKRKLSIAAAFFTMPPVVLLDEPYAGLETSSKKLIARILKSVTSLGKVAVLLATSRDAYPASPPPVVETAISSVSAYPVDCEYATREPPHVRARGFTYGARARWEQPHYYGPSPGIMMSARCQNNVDRKARSAKTRISTDTMDFNEHQGQVTQVRTDSAAAGNDLTLV